MSANAMTMAQFRQAIRDHYQEVTVDEDQAKALEFIIIKHEALDAGMTVADAEEYAALMIK